MNIEEKPVDYEARDLLVRGLWGTKMIRRHLEDIDPLLLKSLDQWLKEVEKKIENMDKETERNKEIWKMKNGNF